MEIKKIVVIGSGTMGSGIAAHLCNANIPVTLLDLTTEISTNARDRIYKSRPPLLIDRSKIDNIKVGNISDNFEVVKEADWIVEAVVERIDIKHQIYEKIFKARKEGAIVSSNTSSIPIKVLSEHLTENEKKDFCITHFFNPVRYMGLLEIVKNENNDLDKINDLKKFCEVELGKGAIICNDTPGFLGNRVGVYAMQIAMTEAFKMKLSVEEADAIFGRPMGIPKTGVFGLYDLIGIDLMADVLKSFIKELPKSDKFHVVAQEIPLVKKLIETGYTGRKGKGGFYRINKSEGGNVIIELYPETSPIAVERFKTLINTKAYDNVAFHRVVKDKLVQSGDLEFGRKDNLDYVKIGSGKSGLGTIKSEIDNPFSYDKGSVGLARNKQYDTEDSQFFIILEDEPLYEGEYTPVGKVIYGLKALTKIKYLDKSAYVLRPDYINSFRMLVN
ncbi:3-hydroxyacyl-CoA dehydrogenase NAD-binding domain-containing protein [Candidatus Pelagibacter sp.]|nr:3-hydroxyacyl-CoA dehydrogenase NAD-binding domain-containing protein [Candidatus Pelagibacter sp.]